LRLQDQKTTDLQLEKAEFADGQPASPTCGFCKQPLWSAYYQIGGAAACEKCKTQVAVDLMSGSGPGRFLKAALFGGGAALAGSALWYGVRVATGYEIGLIAVVVGLMVGGAVRAGSRRRGGLLYQFLAVVLTYAGICAQYVPDIWKALSEQAEAAAPAATGTATAAVTATPGPTAPVAEPAPDRDASVSAHDAPTAGQFLAALAALFVLALASPFLQGFQNVIGILIIAFALWEAWKMNRRMSTEITGPFQVGSEAPGQPTATG
jgi:hypothetical protein